MCACIESIGKAGVVQELPDLGRLLRVCVEKGASIGFMLPFGPSELELYWEDVFAEVAKGSRLVFVARDDAGQITGSVQLALVLRSNGRHRAEVQKLMVLPEFRGQGLGAELMAHVEAEALALGLRLLVLDTSDGSSGARHFYERLGYAYVGGIPGFALDPEGPAAKNAIYFKQLQEIPSGKAGAEAAGLGVLSVRAMEAADWPEIQRIYQEGIDTGNATFQKAAPATWDEFISGKVAGTSIVATDTTGAVMGWAVFSPTSSRCVYAGVVELSVYIAAQARGRGVGSALLSEMIRLSEQQGIWTIQSGTFPENKASVSLQLKHGFRVVGTRERVACMDFGPLAGRWRDVFMLERRSRLSGV